MARIFIENMEREEQDIKLAPGERLFLEDDKGNKVNIGFTNNDDIAVYSASLTTNTLQTQPVATNCIYLRTKAF